MNEELFNKYRSNNNHKPELATRTNKENLINQIVEKTNERNKKHLAKLIAIKANRYKWSETDLHALLQKSRDPKIRNFTAFVKWTLKETSK